MALRALWLVAAVASSHGAVLTSRVGGTRAATPPRRMSGPVVLQVPKGDHIVSSSHHEPARHQPASRTQTRTRVRAPHLMLTHSRMEFLVSDHLRISNELY